MKICIAVAIISYLIGSISFSVIFTKKFAGFDVRDKGSKNAGSTNVLRTAGKKVALITLLCDVLKGICAVLLAVFIGNKCNFEHTEILVQIAAFLVVFGHTFPIAAAAPVDAGTMLAAHALPRRALIPFL